MNLNFRPDSLRPRTLFWLVLVGVCLISAISYTITLACGWGAGPPAQANGHPQVCMYLSSNGQTCMPFKINWQKCTKITDGQTPTPTAPSDGQTSAQIVIPCASTTVTPSATPTASTQMPTPTATPAPTPDTSGSGVPTPAPTPTPDTSSSGAPTPAPTPDTSGNDPQAQAAQAVFTQINQERSGAGLPPLQWSTQLVQSAHNHNLAMQQANQLSHQLPNEADLGTRITNAGITWTQVAENIAESSGNTTDTPEIIATNLNQGMFNEQPPDDGHRLNILSTNTLIGIDVIVDTQNNNVWLTEDFAKP